MHILLTFLNKILFLSLLKRVVLSMISQYIIKSIRFKHLQFQGSSRGKWMELLNLLNAREVRGGWFDGIE